MDQITYLPSREAWEVPEYEKSLWLGRQHRYCIVIPVINEGERIRSLLARIADLHLDETADVIIIDGGSTDGSLDLLYLNQTRVRGLLVKTGTGKLSAQLRCAYAFAMEQGYEGIVTIDGNDKDDPVAIPRFIEALNAGYDFVQGSRFVEGGIAENTPASRDFAIRFIHAPLLSLSSGFHWTDTTQGFRAYSRRMLLDPGISPFREKFKQYELLAYLSHRVPQMGFRCLEIGTARRYPKGEVPTKISAVKGNLKVFETLVMACLGMYDQPGYARRIPPSLWPIVLTCVFGVLLGILAFFPGWMSPDSLAQYQDAQRNIFSDWHPVLMAWWWRQLDSLYAGPALFLIQNLLMYWCGLGLIAASLRYQFGRASYLLPFVGLWPGIAFPLGQIWKDIAFGVAILAAWGILAYVFSENRRLKISEKLAFFILVVFACGVKTNGIVVIPFLFGFWVYSQNVSVNSWRRQVLTVVALTIFTIMSSIIIAPHSKIIKTSPFQYTQTYDLLAISAKTGQNHMPSYINTRIEPNAEKLRSLYFTGGNNPLFYNTVGSIMTTNEAELDELNKLWWKTVQSFPYAYMEHRIENFRALIRLGYSTPAVVAYPGIVENSYKFSFTKNNFSDWLSSHSEKNPWIFFPWLYLAGLFISLTTIALLSENRVFLLYFGSSAIAFVLPHIFIAPSADFRYLYYSYLVSVICIIYSVITLGKYTFNLARN